MMHNELLLVIAIGTLLSQIVIAQSEIGEDIDFFEDEQLYWERTMRLSELGSLSPPLPSSPLPTPPPRTPSPTTHAPISLAPMTHTPTRIPSVRTSQPNQMTSPPTKLTQKPSSGPTSAKPIFRTNSPAKTSTPTTMRRTTSPTATTLNPSTVPTLTPVNFSLEPTLPPSKLESFSPSDTPSSFPSTSPSALPSSSPSGIPSPLPSLVSSFMPSIAESPSPSSASQVPSQAPTRLTFEPSQSQSLSPSESPTAFDPADRCQISVEVTCSASDGSTDDCTSIPVPSTFCDETPFAMIFKFNGGDCNQSSNLQPSSAFLCEDFDGGPPSDPGEQSFIVVTSADERNNVYFSDFVTVGDDFIVDDAGNNVANNMNITIYSTDKPSFETMLQTMVYDSSCKLNLFLKDRFGAVQLIVFINSRQGVVSCDFNVTLRYSVINIGEPSNTITLQTLESETNLGLLNLTDEVDSILLAPETGATFEVSVTLDLSQSIQYFVDTSVVGLSPQGFACRDENFFTFEAGQPSPQLRPTSSPTSIPTTSTEPTPDPEIYSCELLPLISCSVIDGPPVDCENLEAPSQLRCEGDRSPYELVFLYNGGPCPGTNSANGFRCDDRNGGLDDRDEAWLLIRSKEETIFNQTVDKENFIVARGAFDQFTDLTLYSIGDNGPGIVLQAMRMRTVCQEQDDITLLNTFGALLLVGFSNGPSGSQWILAIVQVKYQVQIQDAANSTGIAAIVERATSNGPFAGSRVLRSTPSAPVGRGDTLDLGVETGSINLLESSSKFTFELMVNATSAPNPELSCDGMSVDSFVVQ